MNERDALQAELDIINGKEDPSQEDLNRRKRIMNRLSEIEFAAEQTAKHEERIQQSVEQLTNSMDAVDIHGLPLRALFKDEDCYQLVSIWFKKQLADNTEAFSKQIQAEQTENKQLRDEVQEQTGIIAALKQEIEAKDRENGQLKLENAQLEQYRQNAADIIREKDAEIKRLNEHVDTLRMEAAVGARNAIKVTNIDGGKELAEKIKASMIPVTVMERADTLGKTFRVVLAESGEEKIVPFLEKGKYRLVSQEEAAEVAERFRAEQAAKVGKDAVQEAGVPVGIAPIEVPNFPPIITQDDAERMESVQPAGDGEADAGEGKAANADSAKSLEERVAALEAWQKRVDGQLIPASAYKDGAA